MRPVEVTVLRDGKVEGRAVLGVGTFAIGRTGGADILLPDPGISRRHATLYIDENSLIIEDNGSGNGTFYRNKAIQRQILGDGDEISIPPFQLSFLLSPEPSSEVTWAQPGTASTTIPLQVTGARLIGVGRMAGREYPLLMDRPLVLGRSSSCDVELADPVASREHADVFWQDTSWMIRDRNSSNGTYVNGQRIRERPIKEGDRIRIGLLELEFIAEEQPAVIPPPPRPKAAPSPGIFTPARVRNLFLLLILLGSLGCASSIVLWQLYTFVRDFWVNPATVTPAASAEAAPTPASDPSPTPAPTPSTTPTSTETTSRQPTKPRSPDTENQTPIPAPAPTPTPAPTADPARAESAWGSAQKAILQGDYIAARNYLREALKADPNHAAARATLPGIEQKLRTEAEAAYKEGRRLEDIDDSQGASKQYRKVMTLVGDRSDDLYKRAEARLMGLN